MILQQLKYRQARISDWVSKRILPPDQIAIRQVQINGYQMLVFINETVGRQICWNKCYEKNETQYISNFLKPGNICFDIGANVGYFSLLMASLVADGEVHSFEPIPFCYHLLSCSKHLNKFTNIIINNCAVGELDGESLFHVCEDSAFSSIEIQGAAAEVRRLTVPIVSIDSYVRSRTIEKVDFMKIDVEGAELQVIRGGSSFFSSSTLRPRMIMLEVDKDHMGEISHKSRRVIELLRDHGYNAEILLNDRLENVNIEEPYANLNIFFRPVSNVY